MQAESDRLAKIRADMAREAEAEELKKQRARGDGS